MGEPNQDGAALRDEREGGARGVAAEAARTSSEGSEASGPPGCWPILGGVLAHLQEWRSILVRVALTIAIALGFWVASDPIGYVFAVILVAAVWFWGKGLKPETSTSE